MTQRAPFPVDPHLSGIAMAYRNNAMIADQVLPRVTVAKHEYKYKLWDKANAFTIPQNTRVGRTSQPKQIEFGGTEATASCEDFGLDDPIPFEDISAAPAGMDPRANAVQMLTDLIALEREKRVADLVFVTGTYAAANKVTLSGTSQWSDQTTGVSNPIDAILTGLDACILRPNTMVLGRSTARYLRTHPRIVKAATQTAADAGIVSLAALEDMFEVKILVGMSWLNTAVRGQTAAYSQLWGKHCALLHINPQVRDVNGSAVTFGWTAQFGEKIAGSIPDRDIGLRGGERVRVGESVGEKVVAADVGYLIINAVA